MELSLSVQRDYRALAPDGREFDSAAGFTAPAMVQEGVCELTVTLGAIDHFARRVSGVDAWHAIQMAMWLIYSDFKILSEHGWKFEFFNGEETSVECLLPPVGRAPP